MLEVTTTGWVVTVGLILGLLALDLSLAVARPHSVGFHEATIWSLFYFAMAIAFGIVFGVIKGWDFGGQYFAGYVVEKSLSVDNLFVFVVIMNTFTVPAVHQQKVLIVGIILALVLRVPRRRFRLCLRRLRLSSARMKFFAARIFVSLVALTASSFAGNSVVNLSHYDLVRVDFEGMKREGVIGVIHEATYPRFDRDAYYGTRQTAATRAGLLWGAYHFGDATDPIRQAEHFLKVVGSNWRGPSVQPSGVLLVLDFERNGHYPGGTMRVDQAARFVERIKQRTGKYPGVYGSENRLRAVMNARGVSASDKAVLGNCWLWIANYHYQPTTTSPWNNWRLWQYTGDGKCDLRPRSSYPIRVANIARAERNIFRGSNEALTAWWEDHAWLPAE